MSQRRHFLEVIGGIPLINSRRAAVRYRLRVTGPGDNSDRAQESSPKQTKDDLLAHRKIADDDGQGELRT
jgi:hypothetical protein